MVVVDELLIGRSGAVPDRSTDLQTFNKALPAAACVPCGLLFMVLHFHRHALPLGDGREQSALMPVVKIGKRDHGDYYRAQ